MLTSAQLTAMRAQQAAALPDAAEIWRYTSADDGAGGQLQTWAKLADTTGRVAPTGYSPAERMIADRLTGVITYTVTLPYNTIITSRDRVKIGGRTFEIVGLVNGSWETARRAVCVEVT